MHKFHETSLPWKLSIFFHLSKFLSDSQGAHFDFNFKRLWLHANVMRKFIARSCRDHLWNLSFFDRLENRELYTTSSSSIARSKSPNIFNRKALDSNTTAVNKTNSGPKQQQQRARTASMPGENRKVCLILLYPFFVL